MPEAFAVFLPVALGVAIAAAAIILLRRTGVVAAESRQASAGRKAVATLEARVGSVLDPIIARVDQARRGQVDASELKDDLAAARLSTEGLVEEARGLEVPTGLIEVRTEIVTELERAERAMGMIEYGRTIMGSARLRGRELEAQTAVKRGYLNLLHAREAIGRHAARAAAYRSSVEARRDARRTG